MAPLNPNTTARLFVDYVTAATGGVTHTMVLRYLGSDPTAAAAQTRLANCLTAMAATGLRVGWKITATRVALPGQDFTTATPMNATLASFVGSQGNAFPRRFEAREFVFCGRSSASPRRVRLSIFGVASTQPDLDTFRQTMTGSGSGLNGFWGALVAASSPLVTIDGSPIVWYPYVNMNYNSYWERRLRIS